MKKIVPLLLVGMVAGFVLAQGLNPENLPSNWGGLIALLLSGTTGIGVLVIALRKGINLDELIRSKTTWTALSGFFTTFALYANGKINTVQLVAAAYLTLVAIFIRDAVADAKKATKASAEDRGRLM